MLRSMYSAVAGLRTHQTKMDVIGNNIANVNTYAFKASRVTFKDVFYQTMSGANAATQDTGGRNATQIGYGAKVATIDVITNRSALSSTDRAMDVYINGDGFIPVRNADGGLMYTRLGVTGFDGDGNLIDSNGNFVLGLPLDETTGQPILNNDGTCDISMLSPIKIDPAMLDIYTNISVGPTGEITAIEPGGVGISAGAGLPDWLSSFMVDPNSKYSGDVKIAMEEISVATLGHGLPKWVGNIARTADFTIVSDMLYKYDDATDTFTITGTDAGGSQTTYTGTWDGASSSIELFDATGNLTATVQVTELPSEILPTGSMFPTWINSVTATPNSGLKGNTTMDFDMRTGKIIVRDDYGNSYTGTYNDGDTKVDLVDADGKVAITLGIEKDPGADFSGNLANFSNQLQLTVSGKDMGKNPFTHSVIYDPQGDEATMPITLGDITLSIDPAKVKKETITLIQPSINKPSWISSMSIAEDSRYLGGVGLSIDVQSKFVRIPETPAIISAINVGKNSWLEGNWDIKFQDNGPTTPPISRTCKVTITDGTSTFEGTYTYGQSGTMINLVDTLDKSREMTISLASSTAIDYLQTASPAELDGKVSFQPQYEFNLVGTDADGEAIKSNPVIYDANNLPAKMKINGVTIEFDTSNPNLLKDVKAAYADIWANGLEAMNVGYNITNFPTTNVNAINADLNLMLKGDYDITFTDNATPPDPNVCDVSFTNGKTTFTGTYAYLSGATTVTLTDTSDPTRVIEINLSTPANIEALNGVATPITETVTIGMDTYVASNVNAETPIIGSTYTQTEDQWALDSSLGNVSQLDGKPVVLGYFALAKFRNTEGMEESGQGYFLQTLNSGDPIFGLAGINGTGELTAGALEMSNVDLSKEFTDMITTQRGFQANSKIITVSDEMLQELISMKR